MNTKLINKIFSLRITHYALSIAFLSLAVAFFTLSFKLIEKADTYFVMNLGRYVVENGIPYVDPFTIHEDIQLVMQQWLSGVFFWEAYKFLGVDGLRLADCIIGIILVVTHWRLCLFVSGGNKILSLVMSFAVSLFALPAIVPRPHIISTLILLSEVFFLEKFTRTKDFKFLLPLPVLSVLLINFHAAMWLMLFVIALPFFFVKDVRHVKNLLAAMAAIFFCGLANPYGLDAMTYVFHSYGIDLINKGIVEMMTPTAHDLRGKIFYFSAAFTIFSLTKFKVPWRYIFLSGGLMFMAVMHGRNMLLFYFLATFPLAYVWRDFSAGKILGKRAGQYNGALTLLFFLLLAVNTFFIAEIFKYGFAKLSLPLEILFVSELLFLAYNLLIAKVNGRVIHPDILPKKNLSMLLIALILGGIFYSTLDTDKKVTDETYATAMKFLLKNERPENISLYVNQGYGGLAGMFDIKYYIDSRSEVFLPANNAQKKNILEEYLDLRHGKIYYADFFARYNFTHIITDSQDYFLYDELSRDKNFRVIYESERVEDYEVIRCKIFVPKNGD